MHKLFREIESESISANELMVMTGMLVIAVAAIALVWLMNNHIINL